MTARIKADLRFMVFVRLFCVSIVTAVGAGRNRLAPLSTCSSREPPEWKEKEPFASLFKGDVKTAVKGGEKGALEFVMATHVGMTTIEFEKISKDWIARAKHPQTAVRDLPRIGMEMARKKESQTSRLL